MQARWLAVWVWTFGTRPKQADIGGPLLRPRKKSWFRGAANRVLHRIARTAPGAYTIRPFLHRLRGVRIGRKVFIANEVYLENHYPECVEIRDGAQLGIRSIVIAHNRGAGKVVIEEGRLSRPEFGCCRSCRPDH